MQVELPNEFFTVASLGTFAGATAATFVLASAIQHAFDFNARWFALLVAEGVCLLGVALADRGNVAYLVAVLNGCLVYCTVVGINAVTGKPQSLPTVDRGPDGQPAGGPRFTFRTRWF